MPNFKTHLLAGSVAAVVFAVYLFNIEVSWSTMPVALGIVVIGGLLPDLDHPLAYIRRVIEVFVLLVAVYFIYVGDSLKAIGLIIFIILLWFLTHRGLLHSILFVFVVGAYLYITGFVVYGEALTVGMTTHILLDKVMKGG